MLKKIIVLSMLALICAGVDAEEKIWQFSPEKVDFSKGTVCEKIPGGWRISNPNGKPEFFSKESVKIHPKATYVFDVKLRYATPGCKFWLVTSSVSAKGFQFNPTSVAADINALATAKHDAPAGSRTLVLAGADKWAPVNRSFVLALDAKADRADVPNRNYIAVKSIAADGTVELRAPLRNRIPAGTVVRRHLALGTHDTAVNSVLRQNWLGYSASRTGISTVGRENGKFLYGTERVHIGIQAENGSFDIADLSLTAYNLPSSRPITLGEGANAELVEKARKGEVKVARLSWWGFKKDDATDIIQDAINSKAKTLIIDKMPTPWITRPLRLRGNQEIVFESGAVIEAKRGDYKRTRDCVFTCNCEDNITIRGEGEGGTIRMYKKDYQDSRFYSISESRHCIQVMGSHNIRIENMNLLQSGGDGVLVSSFGSRFPEHIVMRKLNCDDNHRQGISIIQGKHILIEDCKLNNTNGTMPMAGIDIETNNPSEPTVDITVRNCEIKGNTGTGIQVSVTRMDTRLTGDVGITFENCVVKDNVQADIFLYTRTRWERIGHELKGFVRFVNCRFESNTTAFPNRYPIDIEMDISHELDIAFKNCTLKRAPRDREAIRIAFSDPNGKAPQSKMDFSGLKVLNTPKNKIIQVNDHSYTGDTSWLRGIEYKPKAFKNPAPWTGEETIRYEMKKTVFPPVPQYWRAGFWIYGKAGDTAEFELQYGTNRSSDDATVDLISPSGKKIRLGSMDPATTEKFSTKLEETGFHQIDIHGERVHIKLNSANLPAGMMADKYARTFLNFTGDIYFHVPENSPEFAVRVWGRNSVLFVGFEIYDPDGKKVFDVPYTNGAQFDPTPEQRKKAGVWRLRLKHPTRGYFAKCHVAFPGLPPYLGLTPQMIPGN